MNEALNLRTLAGLLGRDIQSSDGISVGRLIEILFESSTQRPVWLGVAPSHGLVFNTLLVPAAGAVELTGVVRVQYENDIISNQPPTDHGEGFASASDERRLYGFFGLPLGEGTDLRVLHAGDDLPDSESVY